MFQYANATILYQHCVLKDLNSCVQEMNNKIQILETSATESSLILNEKKTKQMLVTTQHILRVHNLGEFTPSLILKDQSLERVGTFKLLGKWLSEDLKWSHHVKELVPACYGVLSTLRKLRTMTPQDTKMLLAESLVLSKLNFNDIVLSASRLFTKESTACSECRHQLCQ